MGFELRDGVLTRYLPEDGEGSVVTVPEGVTMIGEAAFRGSAVSEVIFPQTLVQIGKDAFRDCPLLKEVRFPASVRKIEKWAFQRCDELHSLVFEREIPGSIEHGAFYDSAHIQRIRCGSSVMELEPYFADLAISVKYTRVYPDMLLTGAIRYSDLDDRMIRMMFDFYALFHSFQIKWAFRDNAYYLVKRLTEQNDTKRLVTMLRNHDLVDQDTVSSALKHHDLLAEMILDYYEKKHLIEMIPAIQEYAHLFFAAFVRENHMERAVYLLDHSELLTKTAAEKMVDTAIAYTQAGGSAEYQMLAMRALERFSGAEQKRFRL